MAVYPSSVRAFTTKIDLSDTVFALHINDLQDEMVAVQGELGALPKGTYTTVRARLDGLANGKSDVGHSHGTALDTASHDVTARHVFGAALGNPGPPSTLVIGGSAVVGTGPRPAMEDHQHGMPSAAAFGSASLPAGTVVAFAGTNLPAGWLWCDGASYLRTSPYDTLFNAIGVRYGNVDGTHFTVPDFRSKFPMGQATTGGAVVSGGSADAVIVSHAHPGSSVTAGDATHTHYVEHTHTTTDGAGAHAHGVAGALATDLRIVITYSPSGSRLTGGGGGQEVTWTSMDNAGGHNHTTGNMSTRSTSDGASGNANHGHGLTIATQGVSATNANLPPYQTVNYVIKY